MSEEQTDKEGSATQRSADDAWREVGREFEALGESLSRAVRAAWRNEETQRHVRSMQDGLEKMADEVDRAVKDASESERAKRLREEAEKAADSLRRAGEETWREARPQLLTALRRLNDQLQRLIEDLERSRSSSSHPDRTSSEGEGEVTPRGEDERGRQA
jgi:uncharacterized membrane protein YccC